MAVAIEQTGHVATVILSRPEVRNAVDGPTADALYASMERLDRDDSVRVVVLWGDGGNFCAGADLAALGTERGNRLAPDGQAPMGPTRLVMSKPVIAAVEGYAVAGGLELALWCDLRVGAETAILGVFSRRFGVPLIDGGTVRLPRIVGYGHAMDMVLTGREVLGREAKEIGLIDRIVPEGAARAEAELLATHISSFPQMCLRSDRRSLMESIGKPVAEAMAVEFRLGSATIDSGETAAGADRFVAGEGRHGS